MGLNGSILEKYRKGGFKNFNIRGRMKLFDRGIFYSGKECLAVYGIQYRNYERTLE